MTAACSFTRHRSHLLPAALAAAAALAAGDAAAQTSITWGGGGANANWSTAGNWTSGTAPTTSGTWALRFSGTTRASNTDNITPAITVSNLAFSTGTGFTISRFSTASITIIDGGTFSNTTNFSNRFEVPLTLGGTATFSIPTGTLNLFGTTSGGTLIKTGAGSLGLWANSDYSTTAFRVQGGVLNINYASQIPSGSVSLEGGSLTMATGNYAFQVALSANATVRGYASQSPVFTSSTFNTQTAAGSDVTLTLGGGDGGHVQGLIQDNASKRSGSHLLPPARVGGSPATTPTPARRI